MFKTYNKIIEKSIRQRDEKQYFRVERPLEVCPTLISLLQRTIMSIRLLDLNFITFFVNYGIVLLTKTLIQLDNTGK